MKYKNLKLFVTVMLLVGLLSMLNGCATTEKNLPSTTTTTPTERTIITDPDEALKIAEEFIKKELPQHHSEFDYYSYEPSTWWWEDENQMMQTSYGWIGELKGEYVYSINGYTAGADFEVTVKIDNNAGTITMKDYKFVD